jgi:hypothetical protein
VENAACGGGWNRGDTREDSTNLIIIEARYSERSKIEVERLLGGANDDGHSVKTPGLQKARSVQSYGPQTACRPTCKDDTWVAGKVQLTSGPRVSPLPHDIIAYFCRWAVILTSSPVKRTLFVQGFRPGLMMVTSCQQQVRSISDGVAPTKAPSTWMSAPGGVDLMCA